MANEKDLEIAEGGGKKKLMLLVVVVVVLLAGAAAAYFFLMGSNTDAAQTEVAESTSGEAIATTTSGNALYVPLPRPFVFNVPGTSRDRLVQIKVQLLVRGPENDAVAKRHIPLIEGNLLQTFSSANADELMTTAGRDALKNKALSNLQEAMIGVAGSVVIEEVLFTGFVMQ